jgi:uncharacterized membrane protein
MAFAFEGIRVPFGLAWGMFLKNTLRSRKTLGQVVPGWKLLINPLCRELQVRAYLPGLALISYVFIQPAQS